MKGDNLKWKSKTTLNRSLRLPKKYNGIIDDHDGSFYEFSNSHSFIPTGIGLVKLHDEWKAFVMFDNSLCYCINDMYVDENGKAHLSQWSMAGNLYPSKDNNHGFDNYNREIEENPMWIAKKKEFKVAYSVVA